LAGVCPPPLIEQVLADGSDLSTVFDSEDRARQQGQTVCRPHGRAASIRID
jgi:hypothetical protein